MPIARYRITRGGQVSLPSAVRRRWAVSEVIVEDLGDAVVLRPLPADPIAAARGALGPISTTIEELRKQVRREEEDAEARRYGD